MVNGPLIYKPRSGFWYMSQIPKISHRNAVALQPVQASQNCSAFHLPTAFDRTLAGPINLASVFLINRLSALLLHVRFPAQYFGEKRFELHGNRMAKNTNWSEAICKTATIICRLSDTCRTNPHWVDAEQAIFPLNLFHIARNQVLPFARRLAPSRYSIGITKQQSPH